METEGGLDQKKRMNAIEKAIEWGDKIPDGILYKEERINSKAREYELEHSSLIEKKLEIANWDKLLLEFI